MEDYSNQSIFIMIKCVKEDTIEIKEQIKIINNRVSKMENWRGFITGGLAILTFIIAVILFPIVFKFFD